MCTPSHMTAMMRSSTTSILGWDHWKMSMSMNIVADAITRAIMIKSSVATASAYDQSAKNPTYDGYRAEISLPSLQ